MSVYKKLMCSLRASPPRFLVLSSRKLAKFINYLCHSIRHTKSTRDIHGFDVFHFTYVSSKFLPQIDPFLHIHAHVRPVRLSSICWIISNLHAMMRRELKYYIKSLMALLVFFPSPKTAVPLCQRASFANIRIYFKSGMCSFSRVGNRIMHT